MGSANQKAKGREVNYHNHQAVIAAGLDPTPAHADVVAWVENGANWRVCKRVDILPGVNARDSKITNAEHVPHP
jgi:hypothetical protein